MPKKKSSGGGGGGSGAVNSEDAASLTTSEEVLSLTQRIVQLEERLQLQCANDSLAQSGSESDRSVQQQVTNLEVGLLRQQIVKLEKNVEDAKGKIHDTEVRFNTALGELVETLRNEIEEKLSSLKPNNSTTSDELESQVEMLLMQQNDLKSQIADLSMAVEHATAWRTDFEKEVGKNLEALASKDEMLLEQVDCKLEGIVQAQAAVDRTDNKVTLLSAQVAEMKIVVEKSGKECSKSDPDEGISEGVHLGKESGCCKDDVAKITADIDELKTLVAKESLSLASNIRHTSQLLMDMSALKAKEDNRGKYFARKSDLSSLADKSDLQELKTDFTEVRRSLMILQKQFNDLKNQQAAGLNRGDMHPLSRAAETFTISGSTAAEQTSTSQVQQNKASMSTEQRTNGTTGELTHTSVGPGETVSKDSEAGKRLSFGANRKSENDFIDDVRNWQSSENLQKSFQEASDTLSKNISWDFETAQSTLNKSLDPILSPLVDFWSDLTSDKKDSMRSSSPSLSTAPSLLSKSSKSRRPHGPGGTFLQAMDPGDEARSQNSGRSLASLKPFKYDQAGPLKTHSASLVVTPRTPSGRGTGPVTRYSRRKLPDEIASNMPGRTEAGVKKEKINPWPATVPSPEKAHTISPLFKDRHYLKPDED